MNLYINTECITTDNYDEATVAYQYGSEGGNH